MFWTIIMAFLSLWLFINWLKGFAKLPLSNKTKNIVITGCDSGFGQLFAKRMDKKGFRVFAGCLTDEGVKHLSESCSSQARPFQLDVTKEKNVEVAVNLVQANMPANEGLWALVNNAGIAGQPGATSWMKRDDYETVLNVNFHGVRGMCEAFIPLLKCNRGRIVNTSSVAGILAFPMAAPYCVAKYAVEAFSDSLRRDVSHFGISVHLIEPTFYKTNIMNVEKSSEALTQKWNCLTSDVKEDYGDVYYRGVLSFAEDSQKNAWERLDDVADAYEHACLGKYPKIRYPVGRDAEYFWRVVAVMPASIADMFVRIYDIKPKASIRN